MDIDTRLFTAEQDIKNILDRLGKVENKAAGAWKAVIDTNADVADLRREVKDLRKEVEEVKKDMKETKIMVDTTNKTVKVIAWAVGFLAVAMVLAGIFAMKSGSDVPEKVVDLMLPALTKALGA